MWREKEPEKRLVIAVNSSYTLAPWADIIFAMDRSFWLKKWPDLPKTRFISTAQMDIPGVQAIPCFNPGNSGAGAISLAAHLKASKIILLGYDCKYGEGGKRHFFGDHPPGMAGNAGSIHKWPEHFRQVARRLAGKCDIINATRETALDMWPLAKLEDVL